MKNDPRSPARFSLKDLSSNEALIRKAALALVLLPALFAFGYVALFSVNVVNYDQYEFVPLIDKLNSGTLAAGDLFAQHNEHRLVFPRLAMLALAEITHYNVQAEMLLSLVLGASTLAILYALYRRQAGRSAVALLLFAPVAWLFFSPRQYDNLLWGWQLQIFMCLLAFAATVYVLGRSKGIDRWLALGIAGAFVATFSFLNGLIVWPVGLVFILLARGREGLKAAAVWAVAFAAVAAAYFYQWTSPADHPSILYVVSHPATAVQYLLINVGAPLAFEEAHALAAGLLIIIALAAAGYALYTRRAWRENAAWIAFALFSLCTSLACTIGRSGFGTDQALAPRYVTFTALAVISLYVVLAMAFLKSRESPEGQKTALTLGFGIALGVIMLGLIVGYVGGIHFGVSDHAHFVEIKNTLLNYQTATDDDLSKIYPIVSKVREGAAILEKYGLNVFS